MCKMVLWNTEKEIESKRKQDVTVGRNLLEMCPL